MILLPPLEIHFIFLKWFLRFSSKITSLVHCPYLKTAMFFHIRLRIPASIQNYFLLGIYPQPHPQLHPPCVFFFFFFLGVLFAFLLGACILYALL